jgi:hypothetical protein
MKQSFSLLSALIFLITFPGSGLTQQDAGIPPMLENKRPMTVPEAKSPTLPANVKKAKAAPKAKKGKKAKKIKTAKGKKVKKQKGTLASKKKSNKAVKKKGDTAKPRGKSPANRT